MTHAVITGGRGFVGGYLAAGKLESDGQRVTRLDMVDGFDVTDRDSVTRTFADLRPDTLYHLAAFTHVGDSWSAPVTVLRVNVEGTLNVLDAARANGVGRALVVGSSEEYGRGDPEADQLDEDAALAPTTPYGASKVAAGFFALQAWLGHGFETIRVRPFNHTGPGQPPNFLVPALASRVAVAEREGTDRITIGNTEPIRELLDVRDVVRAYRLLMELGTPGAVYNVCRGEGYTVGTIANTLLAASNRSLELEVDPALVRPVDVPRIVGDPTRLHTTTGWKPEHSLAATLTDVLAHAREQRDAQR